MDVHSPTDYGHAVVVYGNFFQFGPGDVVHYPRVQSRMFLCVRAGRGVVDVGGVSHTLTPDDYLFLPWGAAVTYRADRREPFMVGGVHVIPWHAPDAPVTYEVAHYPDAPLAGVPWRGDVLLPGLEEVFRGRLTWEHPLSHLAEYVVNLYIRDTPPEWEARSLGRLFLAEMLRAAAAPAPAPAELPGELRQILRYVHDHLTEDCSLPALAAFCGKSVSSVSRMFRRHLGCTANQWVRQLRVDRAARLLRTTRMPVGAVGADVGIEDPFYFSKLFRQQMGEAPLTYRRKHSRL